MELKNVAHALDIMAEKIPNSPAIHCPTKKIAKYEYQFQSFSFLELKTDSDRIARGLLEYGFNPGDRVALMVTPSFEFFSLTFALFKAGIVPILIDPGIGIQNLKTCLAEAEPIGFIGIFNAHLARILFSWAKKSIQKKIYVCNWCFWGDSLKKIKTLGTDSDISLPRFTGDEIASIIFTSGSTGVPKGVVYKHRNFTKQVEIIRSLYKIEAGEIDLPTFPLFALFNPALGMSSVVPVMNFTKPAKIKPQIFIPIIKQFQITNMFGSPALLNNLSRYCEEHQVQLPSLNRVISAGAPMQPQIAKRVRKFLKPQAQLYTPYGATESLPVSNVSDQLILGIGQEKTKSGGGVCIGNIVHDIELKIIAITDDPIEEISQVEFVTQGQLGEIIVKGEHVTREYFNRASSTQLAKIKDGNSFWHRMGDIGYIDENGYLWFCGRKSHRVILKDKTLYTVMCEGIFNSHPGVYRSALVRAQKNKEHLPVVCIELEKGFSKQQVETELKQTAKKFEITQEIETFLFHPSFPVDIRHNAKIFREKLGPWAQEQIS